MSKSYKENVKNIKTKYYKKGEHKSLKGLCIHADVSEIVNNQIKETHIILTYVDIIKAVQRKKAYFDNLKK